LWDRDNDLAATVLAPAPVRRSHRGTLRSSVRPAERASATEPGPGTTVVESCVGLTARSEVHKGGINFVQRVEFISINSLQPVDSEPPAPTRSSPSQELTAAVGPCCPTRGSYEAAVRAFAHGDRGAARAPADQVKKAVSDIDKKDQNLLEAAAVMHLVLGMRAMEAGFLPQMTFHLDAGKTVFEKIRRADAAPFNETWYQDVAALYLSAGDLDGAAAVVRRALREHASSGGMLLAAGIVNEAEAALEDRTAAASPTGPEATGLIGRQTVDPLPVNRGGRARAGTAIPSIFPDRTPAQQRQFDLSDAEKAYRQALAGDQESEEARLRLGRVLSLEGKGEEAHATLAVLIGASRDQRILYLAHLFLADLATRQKDVNVAASEYKAAIAANPLSRIAYVGLSNLALLAGDAPRAQAYIRDWSLRNATPPALFRSRASCTSNCRCAWCSRSIRAAACRDQR
jgi:tetratricopeptide (TPR) repeat protein